MIIVWEAIATLYWIKGWHRRRISTAEHEIRYQVNMTNINIRMCGPDNMAGVRLGIGCVTSQAIRICWNHSSGLWRARIGTWVWVGRNRRTGRARCDRKSIKCRLSVGPDGLTVMSRHRKTGMRVIIPQLSGVHTRIGTCDSPASLCKISFSIPEPTGNFGSFAGFTFCFRRRL